MIFAAASLVFVIPFRAISSENFSSATALAPGMLSLLMLAVCAFTVRPQLRLRRWQRAHLNAAVQVGP